MIAWLDEIKHLNKTFVNDSFLIIGYETKPCRRCGGVLPLGEKMKIELYQGDCLEIIKNIPDGSVDMILTDPPYSSGGKSVRERQQSTSVKYADNGYHGMNDLPEFSGDNMDQRSFIFFMRMVFAIARAKSKKGSVLASFCDWRQLPALTDAVQAAGWIWRGIVVWDKKISRNIPGRYRNDCEFIVWATNGKKAVEYTPGNKAMPGVYRISSVLAKTRLHQTEKPTELLEELLRICPEGGTVMDMFMGSGSTGKACVNARRNFIGIELDPLYFEVAKRRIEEAQKQNK